MILILLCDGFEEIEALTPLDMLRRAGLDVRTVGVSGKVVLGSHAIPVIADFSPEEVKGEEVSAVILPGGMPGAKNLDASPFVDKLIKEVSDRGGCLAAICAAPLVLGRRGLLFGKRATCYPGFEGELVGATVTDEAAVTDGNVITARGMGAALAFSKELLKKFVGEERCAELCRSIME